MTKANILAIFTSAKIGEPMVSLQTVKALQNVGLEGDRYPNAGFYTGKRIPDTDRGVSIISSKAIAEANQILDREFGIKSFEWIETRRNIVVDIETEKLNSLLGKQFKIGATEFMGTDPCAPCRRPGEQLAFVKAFLKRGGMRARVTKSGLIKLSDWLKY